MSVTWDCKICGKQFGEFEHHTMTEHEQNHTAEEIRMYEELDGLRRENELLKASNSNLRKALGATGALIELELERVKGS